MTLLLPLVLSLVVVASVIIHVLVVFPTLVFPSVSKDPGGKGSLNEWLSDALWGKCKGLEEQMPILFKDFGDNLQNDSDEWREWFDSENPEESNLPGKYLECSSFSRLLILRALRADRLNATVRSGCSRLASRL